MRPVWWGNVLLALIFGVLPQGFAWSQQPSPGDAKELVAVLDLDGVNASNSQLAALSDELRVQLLQSGKFRVVDRHQIDTLLKEQALQQTGCTSQECAVQAGKILGVRKMVVGRVTKIEDELWQVSAQIVDVESAATERAVSYKHEGKFCTLMDQGMSALAAKLIGSAVVPAAIASATLAPGPAASASLAAGQTWRDPTTGMEFVYVPAGNFEMGCGGSCAGQCDADEKPAHRVQLGGFWLAKTTVTQGQWQKVMGGNPAYFKKGDDYPVEQVSWDDSQEFIRRLNAQSGVNYRLPTEAEWEYACRAGGKELAYGTESGDLISSAANTSEAGIGSTTPVGKYRPNALGLYDMSGNVWQWVQDSYTQYGSSEYAALGAVDPVQNRSGADRVFRGGGWHGDAESARCSYRDYFAPSRRLVSLGFRLARTN
jgi:formylglycine-generating enzyme required for sulfatase activity